jgi:hypothetical protein
LDDSEKTAYLAKEAPPQLFASVKVRTSHARTHARTQQQQQQQQLKSLSSSLWLSRRCRL